MKSGLFLIAIVYFHQIAFSQTVPIDSVRFYEGKKITVCAKVTDTYVSKHDDASSFINFGKPYPHNSFTVVIFEKDLEKFKYTPSEYLKGKNICVTGKVVIFKDKPEIIVNSSEQIKEQ